MKKLYITIFILTVTSLTAFKPVKTEEVNWYNWNEGYTQATQDQKLMLVDVYTSWCGWCKKMDRDTYSNTDVQRLLNKNFINIKLNPEKTDMVYQMDTLKLNGYQLLNLLTNGQRAGYPTTVIINPENNKVVHAEAGYQDPEKFKETLKKVLESQERN